MLPSKNNSNVLIIATIMVACLQDAHPHFLPPLQMQAHHPSNVVSLLFLESELA